MIFRAELAEKVLRGEKTVTRRMPTDNVRSPWYRGACQLQVGRHYAVQPARGKPALGRVRIRDVRLVRLGHLDEREAQREGFAWPAEFERTWKRLHGKYDPRRLVWRIEFERLDTGRRWGVERPVAALGWELRTEMALARPVRLVLTARCDAVLPNDEDKRVVEGCVSSVSATDAFAIVAGMHIPLEEIEALVRPHMSQTKPSRTVYDAAGAGGTLAA